MTVRCAKCGGPAVDAGGKIVCRTDWRCWEPGPTDAARALLEAGVGTPLAAQMTSLGDALLALLTSHGEFAAQAVVAHSPRAQGVDVVAVYVTVMADAVWHVFRDQLPADYPAVSAAETYVKMWADCAMNAATRHTPGHVPGTTPAPTTPSTPPRVLH